MSYLIEFDELVSGELKKTLGSSQGQFKEVRTLISLPSTSDINLNRSFVNHQAGGAIQWLENQSEIRIFSGNVTAGYADLITHVHLQSGSAQTNIVRIDLRIPAGQNLISGQSILWGAFNNNYGYYFGLDGEGLFIAELKNQAVKKIYQENWNIDPLLGGSGSPVFNPQEGSSYYIELPSSGYGPITFGITVYDPVDKTNNFYPVHSERSQFEATILKEPVPIRIITKNGGVTGNPIQVFVSDRYAFLFNPTSTVWRSYTQAAFNADIGNKTSILYPIISIRKKKAYENHGWDLISAHTVSSNDCVLYLIGDGQLTNAKWEAPDHVDHNQTIVEVDVKSSSLSGGDVFYSFTSAKEGISGSLKQLSEELNLNRYRQITVAGTSNGNRQVTTTLNWQENW